MNIDIKKKLGLPNYEMLEFQNIFSGSLRKLNYKLTPQNGNILVMMRLENNFDSQVTNEFPLTQDGYDEARNWMAEQFSIFEPNI